MEELSIADSADEILHRVPKLFHKPDYARTINDLSEDFVRKANAKRVAIIGGVVRDLTLFDRPPENGKDVDFILDVDSDSLKRYAEENGFIQNNYSGYRGVYNGISVDFFSFETMWVIKHGFVSAKYFEDVLDCVFLSTDQILFDITMNEIIISDDYLRNMKNKQIRFICEENPFFEKRVRKAFIKALRWGFTAEGRLSDVFHRIRNGICEESFVGSLSDDSVITILNEHVRRLTTKENDHCRNVIKNNFIIQERS